jgi:hypothetical protein
MMMMMMIGRGSMRKRIGMGMVGSTLMVIK